MVYIIKIEIGKLFRIKIVILPILLVLGTIVYSMIKNGEFGYDYSNSIIAYSEKDGKLIYGQKGYEQNKKVAMSYKGEVTDAFLEQMHNDYNNASYANVNGSKFYNSTYSYFYDVFYIDESDYITGDELWKNDKTHVIYGFSGDWDSYMGIIDDFFKIFTVFIIVFAAPLFTFEKECGMVEMVGTVKYGGDLLLKYKVKAVFIVVNIFLFAVLLLISIIHFSQYGFTNADVGVQCSYLWKVYDTSVNCSLGEFSVLKILFGIIGCNIILLFSVLISMLCKNSLASLSVSFVSVWILCDKIVNGIIYNKILNIILAILPINALSAEYLIRAVSNKFVIYMIFIIQIILFFAISLLINKLWRAKIFYLQK